MHPARRRDRIGAALLAQARGLPVHFDSQFACYDHPFHRTITVIQHRWITQDTVSLSVILLLAGCSRAGVDPSPQPAPTTVDRVWLLEASGPVVADTSVTFSAKAGRTVVMRHRAPDDAIFVVVLFPPSADTAHARDSIRVTIHPTGGQYGFTLATSDKLVNGTQATFSYAIHFRTPTGATATYPNPGRFEQLVVPALLTSDNHVQYLAGGRPAADMLRFPVTTAGTYALVAPR